jgi:hypothetical protein
VAKQVVIGQAVAMGYLDRPEVQRTVARMERHMLTQASGPFYQALFPPDPRSENELRALYRKAQTSGDVFVARFPSDQVESAVLGPDFATATPDEQRRRLLFGRDDYGIEVLAGHRSWPFFPFTEIADLIERAPENNWTFHHDPRLGAYAIWVRHVGPPSGNNAAEIPANFQAYAEQITRDRLVRMRRVELLKRSDFAFDAGTAAEAIAFWRNEATGAVELPAFPDAALATHILFQFGAGADRTPVSLETFRRQFNAQFIRALPRSIADLRARAEDFAVEEVDFRAAKALGIDATPLFSEDRHGFAGYQVLELYEKEQVLPRLRQPDSAVENYYRAHMDDYRRPTKLRVRRLRFSTVEAALRWQRAAATQSSPTDRPLSDDVLEVDRSHVPPEFEAVGREVLFDGPLWQPIGPVPAADGAMIYVMESHLAKEALPMSAVASSIRGILETEALNVAERNLSQRFMRQLHFEDRIDYASYGVPDRRDAGARQ